VENAVNALNTLFNLLVRHGLHVVATLLVAIQIASTAALVTIAITLYSVDDRTAESNFKAIRALATTLCAPLSSTPIRQPKGDSAINAVNP
jgi:hypothetical protein